MGLAAFNRMRQLEEMKPENIAKTKEESSINTPVEAFKDNTLDNIPVEKPADEDTEKSTSTRRRRKSE